MCLLDRTPVNRRSRILLVMGSLCLGLSGVMMFLSHHMAPDLGDFLRGFLIGLSITFNLGAVISGGLARRNRLGPS
jgi:hypothetical protein